MHQETFLHPQASSSAPYPQELNSTWKKNIKEPIHMSIAEKSGRPERDSDLRCQSGPSAKNSVLFSGGDSSKNYGADQQRLQISDLHFDKFPTPATFACWKIRFKTEVCACSQFPTEAMQWIKEVEMVDSVDDLRSSSSIRGISMPNFEVLDTRIASALNKIIQNSHFKRRISLEEQKAQKEDRFLRGRQIAYLIYEQFRVTGTDDSVENYTDLFTIALRNDDIQEFDSKWDGILLSMTKIPHDDILEGLYKLRIRESDKLKTGLELYDLETHQKKSGPDYHRLKAMVKRSIEQDIRNKNFGARNGKRTLKEQARMSRWPCKDYLRGTCNDSFCERWHPPECLSTRPRVVVGLGKCSYAHRQVDEQPSKRSKKNGDKSAVTMLKKHELYDRAGRPVVYDSSNTRQLGCVFQDMEPPKFSSILRKSTDMPKPIRRVKFTKAIAHHTKI